MRRRTAGLVSLLTVGLVGTAPLSAHAAESAAATRSAKVVAEGHPAAGALAVLALSAHVPAGDGVTHYSLGFGDKSKAASGKSLPKKLSHRYSHAGDYAITLTVTYKHKRTATAKTHLLVHAVSGGSATVNVAAPLPPAAPQVAVPPSAPAPAAGAPSPPPAVTLAWSTSFSKPVTDQDPDYLRTVSCGSPTFCMATGNDGKAYRFDGSSWQLQPLVEMNDDLQHVSCTADDFCAATNSSGQAWIYDGTHWIYYGIPGDGDFITGISCATRTFCVMAGNDGVITFNGSSWSPEDVINPDYTGSVLDAVSCPTTSFCMAVNNFDSAYTFNGTNWSDALAIRGTAETPMEGPGSVSCSSAVSCVVGDTRAGGDDVYTAGTWSTPSAGPDASGGPAADPGAIEGESCAATTFCVGTNGHNASEVWNGTAWSAPTPLDVGTLLYNAVNGLSCPTTTFCAASTSDSVLLYRPA